jgi:hypothetical protein
LWQVACLSSVKGNESQQHKRSGMRNNEHLHHSTVHFGEQQQQHADSNGKALDRQRPAIEHVLQNRGKGKGKGNGRVPLNYE